MNETELTAKKHIEIKDIILLFMVLFVCVAIWGYGVFLMGEGYETKTDNICSIFALGTSSIQDGVFPWNYEEGLLQYEDYCYAEVAPSDDVMQYEDYLAQTYNRLEANREAGKNDYSSEEYEVYEEDNLTGLYVSLEGERIFSDLDLYNIHEIPLSGMEAHIYEEGQIKEENETGESISEDMDETIDIIEPDDYEFATIDDTYFDDAVFIGDSRMVGLFEYANMNNADFFAKTAMTIYGLMDCTASTDSLGRTVRQGLTDKQYAKIYIMVGINELGTGDTAYFVNKYAAVIEEIRELQPDAIIYIQGIMHVAHARDISDAYINNTNINDRNQALSKLANGYDVFYLDVNPVFDDINGDLNKEYTSDDVHLYANNYATWHTFFLEHAVVLP